MAASLLALLSQKTPNLVTRKGLILTGLQHDFLSPNGKLPINNLDSGFLERTKTLIDEFRGHGEIIWIRTEIDATSDPSNVGEDACNVITSLDQHERSDSEDDPEDDASVSDTAQPSRKRKPGRDTSSPVDTQGSYKRTQRRSSFSDDEGSIEDPTTVDEEYFLTQTAERRACFIKDTIGADFATEFKSSIQPTDIQVTKTHYSAFSSTSLLSTLRMKLITELYICGAMTNLNVYATSMDAARYGIKITLIEDCLGYRLKKRHNLAIQRLVDFMDASITTSDRVIASLRENTPAGRPKVTEVSNPRTTLGGGTEITADMLEVASSDEDEDDEDLLSVRAPPFKSHRPLEIRASRPRDKNLQVVGTGSEPHSQLQRHASAESNAGAVTIQRETKDDVERSGEVEVVEVETQPLKHSDGPGVEIKTTADDPPPTRTSTKNLPDRTKNTQKRSPHHPSNPTKPQHHSNPPNPNMSTTPKRRNRKLPPNTTMTRQTSLPLFPASPEPSSRIHYDLLPPDHLDALFQTIKSEIPFQTLHHQTGLLPRLLACQGTLGPAGQTPIYRHPSDSTLPLHPWTPIVNLIRAAAEKLSGHELNHALIQLYRGGEDYISEHSDKTLDIVPGSFIVNVSFGAERVMRLRSKRSPKTPGQEREVYRVALPHNSALLLSLPTNARFLHSIQPDKRPASQLSPAEKAYSGERISLTFRLIGTFLDASSKRIWGQGAMGRTREEARRVVSGDEVEREKLLKGFKEENADEEVRWAEWYGGGSDVVFGIGERG
jgi:nicotinamidase-related amidase/alkylated DNA repair dioxygenase AlkB